MPVPRGEQLRWYQMGFSAGVASASRKHTEVAEWLRLNAEYRQQIREHRLADCLADLDEVIDVLARAMLGKGGQEGHPVGRGEL